MAVRIKSHWHDDAQQRSSEEIGGAIAFNGWRLGLDKAINLHGEDFVYRDDQQRLDVIAEYMIFQIQVVDRLAHKYLDEEGRQGVVTALALRVADYVQDNGEDLLGAGDHRGRFIETLNQRAAEYSELPFDAQGPGYAFYRHLGSEIQGLMGHAGENRWVIDQVMDVDGPQVYKQLTRIVRDLLD